ncbi:MAG: hypothetical protein CMF38_01320 [Legionellaceae bacterium]|nr:hypothetical protein [Legionellaceae bacterium]HAF88139.1 hypothetical protein [Legionellales bacterium]HCA89886.1 hypothetical protein [Legionellales bacterium]|tara:strand:+ start:602 stop:1129 length:528 start_codon:yes stop_codon:yes gene_type:complete
MEKHFSRKINAIIKSEPLLERVIHHLIEKTVARHDISVQESTASCEENRTDKTLSPKRDIRLPKREAYLSDDYGWLLGLSFALPFFIGIIIGVFLIGDIMSIRDNFLYGIMGAIIGGSIGLICVTLIKYRHLRKKQQLENQGGYVIWITVGHEQQQADVLAILKEHDVFDININD